MEAAPRVDEQFRFGPRAEHQRDLRAGDVVAGAAAVEREIAIYIEIRAIVPQARDHAQPVRRLELLLDVEADSEAVDGVLANRRETHAIIGEVQADAADVVVARFDPESQLPRHAGEIGFAADLRMDSVRLALIELFELIAVGVVQRVGEIGEQVELVVERVRVGGQIPVAQRLRKVERQRVAMRFAAVAADR